MIYIAFTFALALACLATLEFLCMMFLESANRDLKRRVKRLERENQELGSNITALQSQVVVSDPKAPEENEEFWPEYIEDDLKK
jgi:hypothetical protein